MSNNNYLKKIFKKDGEDSIADAGSTDQALQGAEENLLQNSEAVVGAVNALKGLADGSVSPIEAALDIKAAIDAVQGLSGQLSESLMMPLMTHLAAFKGEAFLPVAKQLDPVMGIDVHFVTVPPGTPVPLPHPYISVLFRAKDWVSCMVNMVKAEVMSAVQEAQPNANEPQTEAEEAAQAKTDKLINQADGLVSTALGMAGLSATVLIGGVLPRAITGTTSRVIPHIPMGAGFHPSFDVPVAKDNGTVYLGSLFVTADGDPMAGMMHLNYDCWDIGIIDLFKSQRNSTKKSPDPKNPKTELFVPSGSILPIPWSRPVLVNTIPTPINPLSIGDRLFKAGLGKLKLGQRFRKLAEKGISKLPFSCATKTKLSKHLGTGQSHPVEVAEGYFYTDNEDFSLSGVIPLVWERTWYSYSPYEGPLGYGWHHSYDMAIGFDWEARVATIRMNDGRGVDIELPNSPDKPTFHRLEKLYLCVDESGRYYVKDTSGLCYYFTETAYPMKGSERKQQLLEKIVDRNGHQIQLSYKANGALTQLIDSAERTLTFETDNEGRITTIYAPHPKQENERFAIAQYSYSEEGDLLTHTDALGQPMHFAYQNHLMVKEIWRNGTVWTFTYDGKGTGAKCVEVRGSEDLLHYTFDYSDPHCTLVRDSLGYTKSFYHHNGRVIKYIDPEKGEWNSHYNSFSELEMETDPLGNTTSYLHDKWGNVVKVIEPDGSLTQMEYYDPYNKHLLTEATDPRGGKWEWNYDEVGNLTERKTPLGATTAFKYEEGLLRSLTDALGATTEVKYDDQKNIKQIKAPNEGYTKYEYDHLGQCTAITNPHQLRQLRHYDLLGRVEYLQDFDNNNISLSYDAMDNVVRYRDSNGKDIRYRYKGLNKLIERTEGDSTVRFKYDTEGQLRRIVNEEGEEYLFDLDGNGNVRKENAFDGLIREYERNQAGWVTRVQRTKKRYTNYDYDPNGRIAQVSYHDGSSEQYLYEAGFLKEATNADAVVSFERDKLGNITKESTKRTNSDEVTEVYSEYDILGRRIKLSSNLGAEISFELDKLSNISHIHATTSPSLEGQDSWEAKIDYDELGLEIYRQLTGGVKHETRRDRLGRMRHQVTKDGQGANIYWKEYQWGIDYRLYNIIDHTYKDRDVAFDYDDKGYLVRAIYAKKEEQFRTPDKLGNLYETKDKKDRKYKNSQLQQDQTYFYHYDVEGNLIFKEHIKDVGFRPFFSGSELRDLGINPKSTGKGFLYTWNANGSLRSVTDLKGVTYRFRYDAFGRRLEKRRMASTFRFVWDGNVLLHETFKKDNSENTELTTWVFEGFVPTAKLVNGKAYSIISDHLGTPILAIDSEGNEVWNRQLDIYGRVKREIKASSLGDDVRPFIPFLYQGQYYDFETNLAYNRYRYYSPETGAYISQDPIGLAGGNPTLYGYVFDPNSWIDPLGLSGRGGAKHKEIQEQLRDDLKGLGKNVGTEGQIKLKNDKSRFGDVVVYADDKKKQILEVHQIGDMRTRGGFRPSSRERGAIMDIREALGDNVRIVFHDKKGQVTLIDPDKADDWKEPSKKHRKNSC
ncbi:RHS repeat protein [Capnocytophaga sp. Marseille-Q4570]|uniref:RHS repeat protein n=2 Tax=Capnocytophaga TaxID=1016 RepID=A0ABS3PUN7_9FLAO|nr:DUF6531 domain-containing protein [Capnocytophaga bilenii]MBO1883015.1 RHS repeat protein [Capnocytophaga bilenii]